jgi:histone deacetylase 11
MKGTSLTIEILTLLIAIMSNSIVILRHIYPADGYAKGGIASHICVDHRDHDVVYHLKINKTIKESVDNFSPDFIVYNAGTDCMVGDPLGNLSLSGEGIIKRDEIVFEIAISHKIPILMVLSGGYQSSNAPVIANSVENLLKKFKTEQNN